jgi:DNA-directed RNA polymerase subunit omega
MARITVEDCLTQQTNRFGLVLLAAKRAKLLLGGSKQAIEDNRGNKAIVTALREIADGQVRFMTAEEEVAQREAEEKAKAEAAEAKAGSALPAGLRLGGRFTGGGSSESAADSGDDEGSEGEERNGTSVPTL